jgi:single-strand DNA-binding protein
VSAIEAAFFGALGRDAESKVSNSGKPYLRLNVRCGDGDQAQWVSVMAFDQSAIDVADKLTKGSRVYIEGRLSINEWSGQDGAKRHGLSVMSWHCRLAEIGRNRPKRDQQKQAPASGRERAARSDYAPAGGVAGLNDDIPDFR